MAKRIINTSPVDIERELVNKGNIYVIELDEAGRGALAGDLAIGYCVLPLERTDEWLLSTFEGVTDSKKLSAKRRNELAKVIHKNALTCGVVHASPQHIDECGLSQTVKDFTDLAIEDAIFGLRERSMANSAWPSPDESRIYILGDKGLFTPYHPISFPYPMTDYVNGELKSLSIAAASIIAKVTRDETMIIVEPEDDIKWGFAKHKGYGTAEHIAAIEKYGVSDIHRKTFAPISSMLLNAAAIEQIKQQEDKQ